MMMMSIGGITTTGAQYSKTWEKSALLRICDISQNTKKIPSTQTFQKTMRLASWLFFPLWMISQFIFFLLFFVVVWFHEFYYYHYCSITPSPFLGALFGSATAPRRNDAQRMNHYRSKSRRMDRYYRRIHQSHTFSLLGITHPGFYFWCYVHFALM